MEVFLFTAINSKLNSHGALFMTPHNWTKKARRKLKWKFHVDLFSLGDDENNEWNKEEDKSFGR